MGQGRGHHNLGWSIGEVLGPAESWGEGGVFPLVPGPLCNNQSPDIEGVISIKDNLCAVIAST